MAIEQTKNKTAQEILNEIGISFPALEQAMDEQEQADQNISKLFNKNPKHKRISKEISEMLEEKK